MHVLLQNPFLSCCKTGCNAGIAKRAFISRRPHAMNLKDIDRQRWTDARASLTHQQKREQGEGEVSPVRGPREVAS
jgi:hypothetical protein